MVILRPRRATVQLSWLKAAQWAAEGSGCRSRSEQPSPLLQVGSRFVSGQPVSFSKLPDQSPGLQKPGPSSAAMDVALLAKLLEGRLCVST